MHFDILTQDLPETVVVGGVEYPIRHDFRAGIEFEKIVRGDDTDENKILRLLHLFYKQIPTDLSGAIEKIMWFYRCGETNDLEEEDQRRYQRRYQSRRKKEPACVFEQDAPYIFASFLEQYGIDLTKEDMHWWRFMALFECLGDDTKISKIMYYRKASTSGVSKERRAFLNEMKKLYAIKENRAKKMTLEQRNQSWRDYVNQRFVEG